MNGGNQPYNAHKRNANTIRGQQEGAACGALARNKRRILIVLTVGSTATVDTLLWQSFGWMYGLPAMFAALFVIMLVTLGWRWFYIAAVTYRRDFTALWAYIKLLLLIRVCERKNFNIGYMFDKKALQHPKKLAIISETQRWTFRQLYDFSNHVAIAFQRQGYGRGDVIGLLLENRAEYVGFWLGLSRLGIVTALINTNLKGPSLRHSINVAKCSALIYGEDFCEAIEFIANDTAAKLYQFNNDINKPVRESASDLATLLHSVRHMQLTRTAVQSPNHHDKLLYIYTSGTTGLPKAAVISHSRYIFIAIGIHFMLKFKIRDIYYTPLPLYHTAGGVMSIGQTVIFGSTVVIRKKFSASAYFADCVRFRCTVGQYIGEMARYVLATPSTQYDRRHRIRMIFGNGLRPQIWQNFVQRFNIPKVGEFYGATEGNANIINNDNTVGAIGFISRIFPQIYPISIIKADPDTGVPIRGADGLCQPCAPGEAGVFIGKIIKGNPSREFLGYADEGASSKKIVRDVFRKGDMAFISGDLLTSDERGYLQFVDRTGDTFRWKGENVSTSEVEAQISNISLLKDTIVYGVAIPNTEGRAGMAAIYDPERQLNLDYVAYELSQVLPPYARPQFIRILTKLDITGTYKLRKVDLQKEGYNPHVIDDMLFYRTTSGSYELLSREVFEKINQGLIRF